MNKDVPIRSIIEKIQIKIVFLKASSISLLLDSFHVSIFANTFNREFIDGNIINKANIIKDGI
jgi:hypothetical protein